MKLRIRRGSSATLRNSPRSWVSLQITDILTTKTLELQGVKVKSFRSVVHTAPGKLGDKKGVIHDALQP